MAARDRARRGERGTFALFAIGAIMMVNMVAARVHGRLDLTEDRRYTLSSASRDIVRALPEQLTIKAYLPADLPLELAPRGRYLRDLLEEYRTASGGKLRLELDDPHDVKTQEEATRCGIEPTTFELRHGQKLEAGRAILGLCLWYDGHSRALAAPGSLAEMEYQISAAIKRVAHKPRKLAFSTGHGERDLGDGYSFVKLGLGGEHELVTLNPSGGIGDDVDLLIVAGPRRPFDDLGRRAIESFLARGKGVVFLLDGMVPAPGDGGVGEIPGVAVDTGLGPLLERYGFRIRGDLVFDRQNAPGPVPGRQGALFANRPAFVEVTRASLAPAPVPPLVEGIPALVFPSPSSIDLWGPLAGGQPPGAVLWPLARTSSASWRLQGAPNDGGKGPSTLAYAYRGPGGPAPPVRMVVFGSSGFAADEVMQLVRSFPIYAAGAELLFRAVDWLLEDDALSALRANVQRPRPLATGSDEHAAAFTWGNAVGVPLAFCAVGMLRWRLRRGGRRRPRFGADGGGPR